MYTRSNMNARSCDIASPISAPWTMSPAACEGERTGVPQDRDRLARQVRGGDHAGPHRIVDVVIDVGDAVHQADDLALQRRRLRGAPGVADDPVAHRHRQIQAQPLALQRVDDAQRVLVVAEGRSEALPQAAINTVLADVTEWWMAEIVTEADRLHQILVELQRPGDRARYLGHLQRVREPRAVMIAPRSEEHTSELQSLRH